MPRHIVRLILLLVAFGILSLAAIRFLTIDSFYQYGHYRGDSVAEIAADRPNYKGVGYCESCHAARVAEWSKGAHNNAEVGKVVLCEVCHGAAGNRQAGGTMAASAIGAEHPKNLKLVVPADTRALCTLCHEKTAGRPAQQPQIVVADHAGSQQCKVCHNPHAPKLELVSAAPNAPRGDAAKGEAKAAACAGCHGAAGVSKDLPGPGLAGQNEGYFVAALVAYRTGARDDPMMRPAAQGLTDEDVANLAAYYAGLKCESALGADRQAASPGRAAAAACVACHGADGATSNRAWPNLVGLSKQHLLDALKAYRSGARKNAMMAGMVKDLSDAATEEISAYYAAASCK